jgi:hypothetical protein
MTNNLPKIFILLLPIILSTSSCTDLRQAMGKEKVIPDEYSVALTPSLIIPPGYRIDPELIMNNSSVSLNQNALLTDKLNLNNKEDNNKSNFTDLFGSKETPKNIRKIVDEETLGIALSERTGIDVLFGNTPQTGFVIDTKKESLRIRNNKISGKKLDVNASPAFEINSGQKLLIK